ncbi:hypothetical protein M407DRAFT_31425 [Tulasnella calospora MUT 4182]|uniref:Uncharacterized protein n=1 Tax=Tulasnella calospora MUT 4182 TaxID=1051891 RepID=A0A0C3LBQ2_9AGAM|nr:hypothetical protein M407DRAFT_31425 [Tulasnella calospora MUT 4182]
MAQKSCLLATCQYLRQLVEPLLYRFLNPDGSWKSYRRIWPIKTLGKHQDLLLFIRSFRGFLTPISIHGPSHPLEEVQKDNIWPMQRFQGQWLPIVVPLLTQAINMKLNSLALNSTLGIGGQLDFTPLLRRQQELTRSWLNCVTAQFEGLTMEDVLQLTSFKGTLPQATLIVPGQPARKLEVSCLWLNEQCLCLSEHAYQKLALPSEAIKEFKIAPHCRPDNGTFRRVLQLIAQYLPKLKTW